VRNTGKEEQQTLYELEFEFSEDVADICRAKNGQMISKLSTMFWDSVIPLLSNLSKSTDSVFFKDINLQKITVLEEIADLREQVITWIPRINDTTSEEFPGSIPINFSRRYFPDIQSKKYFV